MDLQVFFQWHKLLHFILPIIVIVTLQKRLGLVKICVSIFVIGLVKEIYDVVAWVDPIWESMMDTVFNVVGIGLGITVVRLIKNAAKTINELKQKHS